ncbi:LacI family DNA-binding transcriptional regulator [Pseudaestuariivita rosea]|uniref:LacI family DNA-binding transcriptional regulator n=1 Tax=Pseudaestuariivita rosea TaxID=2763263 RepID=UPI001ABABB81|nr:LacI family DNA-binding transcriptional regulator [Pseudaestuariivita rosea]
MTDKRDNANSGTGPVTQADVARFANVSTATVSRVLNGSSLVRPKVRETVEQAIAQLGYVPNEGARALARRRSNTLGAIIPTLNNAMFAAGMNAFEEEARQNGYGLFISVSNYDAAQESFLIRQMIERGVEGLLLVGNTRMDEARDLLQQSAMRHVCAWAYDPAAGAPNVGFDNAKAMYDLVDHVVDCGYRKIAMLAAMQAGNDRAQQRVQGVRARLAHHGLKLHAFAETRYSVQWAKKAVVRILSSGADAIICGNDVIAYGVLSSVKAKALTVPRDIAVVGFDDLPLSADLDPALTTVRVPAHQMGQRAALELLNAIEEDRDVRGYQLETHLVIRDSTMQL